MSPCPSGTAAAPLGLVSSANLVVLLLHLISLSVMDEGVKYHWSQSERHCSFLVSTWTLSCEQSRVLVTTTAPDKVRAWIRSRVHPEGRAAGRHSCREHHSGRGWVLRAKRAVDTKLLKALQTKFAKRVLPVRVNVKSSLGNFTLVCV